LKAIIGNSLGPPWRDVSGEIGGWLADAGYAVQSAGFTVDDFENMSDVSVLFWQTHSGEGQLRPDAGTPPPGGGPPVVFAFWTSTASSGNPPQKMKVLRDDGSLALAFVDGVFRYAITDKYIRERLKGKFSPAALVAIDSCTGAGADAAWAAAGVSHFVAWSALSGNISYLAFEKYFDRLLGANAAIPLSTPKERSFPSGAVEAWMQRDGYDLDPSIFETGEKSVSQLKFLHHPANGDFAILRPSIYRALNTAPGAGQTFFRFTLDGSFGDETWSKVDGDWVVKMTRTLADGGASSGTQIISIKDDNTLTVQVVAREVDGEPAPVGEPVTVVRVAEKAAEKVGAAKTAEKPGIGKVVVEKAVIEKAPATAPRQ